MAKFRLKPGEEWELVTPEELRATMAEVLSGHARGPLTFVIEENILLDSNGNTSITGLASTNGVTVPLYQVDAGFKFRIHRIQFNPDGYNEGNPFQSSTGYVQIRRGGRRVDGAPLGSSYGGGLPVGFTYGTADAPLYQNGQNIDCLIYSGPPSTAVQVDIEGTLEPLVTG